MSERFPCRKENCGYSSTNFNRLLSHIWDKHSLDSGFTHVCGISSCQSFFSNLQSFRRNVSKKHSCFFNNNMKVYNKNRDCDIIPDENEVNLDLLCNENLSLNNDDDDYNYDELLVAADEKNEGELDFMFLISRVLLELREKFNVTTEVTRFVSEKFLNIIRIDRKEHSDAIHKP